MVFLLTLENIDGVLEDFEKITGAIAAKVINQYRVEITLNHPHTKPWMKKTFHERMEFYNDAMNFMRIKLQDKFEVIKMTHHFELAGDHFHSHGYIDFSELPVVYQPPVVYPLSTSKCLPPGYHSEKAARLAADLPVVYPAGICSTLTDIWLWCLPKRYNHCLKGNSLDNFNAWYQRVCIPQCNIQFRNKCDFKRTEHWDNYIVKNIISGKV